MALPSSQELGCSYADVAAQDGEALLRAILASQRPDRCKRAQAFISTQGLRPDTVAELVAEEVTRELLTPSEGTGALLSGLPGLSDHTLQLPALRIRFMLMYILYAVLARCQVALEREYTAFIYSFKNIYLLVYFWPCLVFIAACRPFLVVEREVSSLAGEHGLLLVVAFLLLWLVGSGPAASVLLHVGCSGGARGL